MPFLCLDTRTRTTVLLLPAAQGCGLGIPGCIMEPKDVGGCCTPVYAGTLAKQRHLMQFSELRLSDHQTVASVTL